MARPEKPADERRSEVLQLRLTIGEREALEKGAAKADDLLSSFIRNAALEKAEKLKRKPR